MHWNISERVPSFDGLTRVMCAKYWQLCCTLHMELPVHAVSWWLERWMFRNRSVPSRSDVASHLSDLCHRINAKEFIRGTLTEGTLHLSICRTGVVFEITFPSSLLFSVQQSPFHTVKSPCARSCPFKYCISCWGKNRPHLLSGKFNQHGTFCSSLVTELQQGLFYCTVTYSCSQFQYSSPIGRIKPVPPLTASFRLGSTGVFFPG